MISGLFGICSIFKKTHRKVFQKRKHFDQDKRQDFAASIDNEGQIEPIIMRPKADRYERIAGERRLRVISQYTSHQRIHI